MYEVQEVKVPTTHYGVNMVRCEPKLGNDRQKMATSEILEIIEEGGDRYEKFIQSGGMRDDRLTIKVGPLLIGALRELVEYRKLGPLGSEE